MEHGEGEERKKKTVCVERYRRPWLESSGGGKDKPDMIPYPDNRGACRHVTENFSIRALQRITTWDRRETGACWRIEGGLPGASSERDASRTPSAWRRELSGIFGCWGGKKWRHRENVSVHGYRAAMLGAVVSVCLSFTDLGRVRISYVSFSLLKQPHGGLYRRNLRRMLGSS